jgi:hypothetical protein
MFYTLGRQHKHKYVHTHAALYSINTYRTYHHIDRNTHPLRIPCDHLFLCRPHIAHNSTHKYKRAHTHSQTHTHTHIYIHAYRNNVHSLVDTQIPTCTRTHSLAHISNPIYSFSYLQRRLSFPPCTHTHTHTHTHEDSLSLSLTHTHTHAHTHAQNPHTHTPILSYTLFITHTLTLTLTLTHIHTHRLCMTCQMGYSES